MSYEWGKARRIFSGVLGYDYWMKTVIHINQFDQSEIAQYRLRVIKHYERFGLSSTLSAFPIKRSTLFLWKHKLRQSGGKLFSLIPLSTRPKQVRQMTVHPFILVKMEKLRRKHYRLGKQKIKTLLDNFCHQHGLRPPSVSLIGKIIKRHRLFFQRQDRIYHDASRKRYTYHAKTRVKRAPSTAHGGYVQADMIETYTDGLKRYTFTFVDIALKVSYAKTFAGKLSKYAKESLQEFRLLLPVKIHTVQTDNGAEFAGVFDRYLSQQHIKHLWTYPNCPKVNSFIERYNRSIQEEWMSSYLDEIYDTDQFNRRLQEYLYFYHNQRVHEGLGLKTPAQVVGKELKSPICV